MGSPATRRACDQALHGGSGAAEGLPVPRKRRWMRQRLGQWVQGIPQGHARFFGGGWGGRRSAGVSGIANVPLLPPDPAGSKTGHVRAWPRLGVRAGGRNRPSCVGRDDDVTGFTCSASFHEYINSSAVQIRGHSKNLHIRFLSHPSLEQHPQHAFAPPCWSTCWSTLILQIVVLIVK